MSVNSSDGYLRRISSGLHPLLNAKRTVSSRTRVPPTRMTPFAFLRSGGGWAVSLSGVESIRTLHYRHLVAIRGHTGLITQNRPDPQIPYRHHSMIPLKHNRPLGPLTAF